MKIKVAEASGVVLDWMVAKCEGADNLRRNVHRFNNDWILDWPRDQEGKTPRVEYLAEFSPTNSWAQGGPIIAREGIGMLFDAGSACKEPAWFATPDDQQVSHGYEGENFDPAFMVYEADGCYGPTPLTAAMRCYTSSRLGEEVEVPDELFLEKHQ